MRFRLPWLFALTAAVNVALFAYREDPRYAFTATVIGLPLLVAAFSRIRLKESHAVSLAAMYTTAMIISALTTAAESWYLTFFTNSQGILVGGGWFSVVAAAIFGLVIGILVGIVDTLLYVVTVAFRVVARNCLAHHHSA